MVISFGLTSSQAKRQIAATPLSRTSIFFETDDPNVSTVKRCKVKEMSNGLLHVDEGSVAPNKYGIHRNAEGHAVIPCSNRLESAEKETRSTIATPLKEIRYGLNVLPSKTPKVEPTRIGGNGCLSDTKTEGSAYPASSSDTTQNSGIDSNEDKRELDVKDTKENGSDAPSTVEINTDHPKPKEDSDVAKIILSDIEKQKWREKLFGADLIERSSSTVPILLRKNNSRLNRGEEGPSQEAPSVSEATSYEKVPVEEFGLAMLLGMGFDPKTNTNKPKEYKKRVYERAGLGADAQMKYNMEALTDASLIAKMKKDQMYHMAHSDSGPSGSANTWLTPGLYVRVVERSHANYGDKGIVKKVEPTGIILDIRGTEVSVSQKAVESVVSLDAVKCKVVRRVAKHAEKFYVPIGTIVDIAKVTSSYAKILFREKEITVSLDDICEFR